MQIPVSYLSIYLTRSGHGGCLEEGNSVVGKVPLVLSEEVANYQEDALNQSLRGNIQSREK